jgi:hypothetical protein
MVHEEYAANYEQAAVSEDEEMSVEASPLKVSCTLSRSFIPLSNLFNLIQGNEGVSLFANFSVGASSATTLGELDEYLSRPVENTVDPLKWWNDKRRVYLNLLSMALDYLSIPCKHPHLLEPPLY